MTEQVLLIVDPSKHTNLIREALSGEGYQVEAHDRSAESIEDCLQSPADVIVMVAEAEAAPLFELCRTMRAREISTPCLMVTAGEGAATAALRCGADDCISGCIELAEVVARVEALLRRAKMRRERGICFGGVEVDVRRRRATTPRGKVELAPKEMRLLSYLCERAGAVVSRDELLREVWDYQDIDTRTVDTHMAALRRKLESDPRRPAHLLTVRTRGYQFQF